MTDDLIKRLRRYAGEVCLSTAAEIEAADALEVQDRRIAELECLLEDESKLAFDIDGSRRLLDGKLALANERIAELEKSEEHLGNILAMLHRDGGHYQGEHGTDNAVGEATMVWSELILRAEKTEADLAAARAAVDSVMAMADIWLGGSFSPEERLLYWRQWKLENASAIAAIAAARGEQPRPKLPTTGGPVSLWEAVGPGGDVCPTCEDRDWISSRLGDCPDCGGTGKKETK